MVYKLTKIELASHFACKLYRYHIHIVTATEILCGLFSYRLYPRFILWRSFKRYNTIKWTGFHAAETEAAGSLSALRKLFGNSHKLAVSM